MLKYPVCLGKTLNLKVALCITVFDPQEVLCAGVTQSLQL